MDRNVIVGWVSTSKKSLLRRCPSRWSLPVLIDERSICASACDSNGLALVVMLAVYFSKCPRTLDTIRCRTTKPISVWAGSRLQVPLTYPGMFGSVVVIVALLGTGVVKGSTLSPQCDRAKEPAGLM